MTIYDGRPITQDDMNIIGSYMADDIRESIHCDLAPCTPEEFLCAYLAEDPEFEDLLVSEFGFEADRDASESYPDEPEMPEVRTGMATTFNYDGIDFLIANTGDICEVYANSQFQFGIDPTKTDDIVKLVIMNYQVGNIFIEE